MATARKATAVPIEDVPEGRFYELQKELAPRRRTPYRLTRDIVIHPLTKRQAETIRDSNDETEQLKTLLGEHHDAVNALYDARPLEEWVAFQRDLYDHFYGEGAAQLPGGSQGS